MEESIRQENIRKEKAEQERLEREKNAIKPVEESWMPETIKI